MKTKLVVLMLMAGGALLAETHVAIGVQIGGPGPVAVPPPVVVNVYRPPCPGPGYLWIEGYYDGFGNWNEGYWALPPYAGAYWVAPRFLGGHFYAGYWGGPRGVYGPEARFAPPAYERGHERGFGRRMPERYEHGFRERGNGPGRGAERGEFRQGFRR
ncbi:MAG TPA: hypothetical protein VFA33_09170 [Bryobacteraceae bacterium]|nr:hypothetical protein [Bryobacteraceae bacterium]